MKPIFSKTNKYPKADFVDAFSRQLKELFFIKNNQFVGQSKEEVYKTKEFKEFVNKHLKNFNYIYFPWNNTTVKCVKKDDYLDLKTNRNQDLIASKEQEKFKNFSVAVLGMSVGSNIAYVLTQAGISNSIILADFDELDTTNLNRIWGGVHQIGMNKAAIAARKIYEGNPYANIQVLPKGITPTLLERYLKAGKISAIIEEVDAMPIKIEVRQLAIKYNKPVLMITDNGDSVVLTVERYDLGYKKIFGHDGNYWNKVLSEYKSPGDFAKIVVNDIVGGVEKVDPRMMTSVQRVLRKELVSWPQLGSAALLGGVATTIAVKNIVRGIDKKPFRREYVSVL